MSILQDARMVQPELGDKPGPGEVGFVMCEYGHVGQTFIINDEADVDIPKGEWHPYCVGCIMLAVVKLAKLKPMRFFISKAPVERPDLVVPPHGGLFLPGDREIPTQGRG